MALELEQALFKDSSWKRVKYTGTPLTPDQTLIRILPRTKDQITESALAFARQYGDGKNYNTAPDAKNPDFVHYVDDPQADSKVYPGRWRVISVDADREKTSMEITGIIETLQYGLIMAIYGDPAKWTEARLKEDSRLVGVGAYFHFQFVGVDPDSIEAITAGLLGASWTDPVVKGQKYEGTWYNFVVKGLIAEDGSGVIDILMGNMDFQLTLFDNLGVPSQSDITRVWKYPAAAAQTLITAWRSANATGSAAQAQYDQTDNTGELTLRVRTGTAIQETKGHVAEASCKFVTTAYWYWGLLYADALTMIDNALIMVVQGVEVRIDGPTDSGDGHYDIRIHKTVQLPQIVPEYTAEEDYLGVRTVYDYLGSLDAGTSLVPVSPVVGTVYDRSVQKLGNCLFDIRLGKKTSTERIVGPVVLSDTIFETEQLTDYLHARTKFIPPAGVTGHLYRADPRIQDDQTWSGPLSEKISHPVEVDAVTSKTAFDQVTETEIRNKVDMPTVPDPFQGTVYDQTMPRLKEDLTYDGSQRQKDSHEIIVPASPVEETYFHQRQEQMYFNARNQPVPPADVQGALYRVNVRLTDDLCYSGTGTVDIAKTRNVGPVLIGRRISLYEYESQNLNVYGLSDIPMVKGSTYARSFDLQEDQTYREIIREQDAQPVSFSLQIISSLDEEITLYSDKNVDSVSRASDVTEGEEERYESIDLNDFQLYDAKRIVRTRKLPNSGNELSWETQGETTVWTPPLGGATVIIFHKFKHYMGWTTDIAAKLAHIGVAYHISVPHYMGNGQWEYYYIEAE